MLILSQYCEPSFALELIGDRPEGVGYLLKERVGRRGGLRRRGPRVADGGSALDPEVVGRMLGRSKTSGPLSALTPRERDVLAAMAEGKSNLGIARVAVHQRGRRREARHGDLPQARHRAGDDRASPRARRPDVHGARPSAATDRRWQRSASRAMVRRVPGDLADANLLADEQSALRRVAELVAAGASESTVFDAVTDEACRLLGDHFTALLRFEPDEPPVIVAIGGADAVRSHHARGHADLAGRRRRRPAGPAHRPGRPDRALRAGAGPNAAIAHELGLSSGVGAPILTEGQVWGALTVLGSGQPLPAGAEDRLGRFAELAATAISNAQARTDLAALAREQAALLRVAELVARGVPQETLFLAVASEASRLLGDQAMTLTRFDSELELEVVAACGGPAPVGTRIAFERRRCPIRPPRKSRGPGRRLRARARRRLAAGFGLAAAVAAPISVQDGVWGMLTATSGGAPLPPATEQRLEQFAKLVASALANGQARAELQALADEQAALRRVAQLAAQEAPVDAVLEAVAVQASNLAGVDFTTLLRFAPDGSTEIVAVDGAPGDIRTGMRAPAGGDGAVQRVWRSGRAARIDDLAAMTGHWPRVARQFGFSASVAVPILLERRLWGALVVVARNESLPASIEQHLADFAELASTAIAAAQTRQDLHVLASQQAALRRVAELVAHGAAPDEVFGAVTAETSKQLGDLPTALLRYEPDDDVAIVVARCNSPVSLGLRIAAGPDTGTGDVRRTSRPAHVDRFDGTAFDRPGVGVAVPVIVEGNVWGTLVTSTPEPPLPIATEDRLTQFAELAAAAIANAENRAKLTASRARVVVTADETRRRLQRDLHDGAQQRLVHAQITLELAREAAATGQPAAGLIGEALAHTERANRELRDLVRGIVPAALTGSGLRTGIESLTDDMPLPIDLRVTVPRLGAQIETTAYFIVAEALTNVIKHARATHATVEVRVSGRALSIDVSDNGAGGADARHGTGLTGLLDRIEAANGTLTLSSPPGHGTTLHAALPLDVPAQTSRYRASTTGRVGVLDLRLLVDHRERLVRRRVALNNALQWHLHDLWPELRLPGSSLLYGTWAARVTRRLARTEQTMRVRGEDRRRGQVHQRRQARARRRCRLIAVMLRQDQPPPLR